uniref:Uncharacterized protein n=1 Tax=Oryza brachyantha TaxID=4533 RepID=J3NCP5_ORYBR
MAFPLSSGCRGQVRFNTPSVGADEGSTIIGSESATPNMLREFSEDVTPSFLGATLSGTATGVDGDPALHTGDIWVPEELFFVEATISFVEVAGVRVTESCGRVFGEPIRISRTGHSPRVVRRNLGDVSLFLMLIGVVLVMIDMALVNPGGTESEEVGSRTLMMACCEAATLALAAALLLLLLVDFDTIGMNPSCFIELISCSWSAGFDDAAVVWRELSLWAAWKGPTGTSTHKMRGEVCPTGRARI